MQSRLVGDAWDFEESWDLPNVVGALDGKHIQIEAPANSVMLFLNYKELVLFSLPFVMPNTVLLS